MRYLKLFEHTKKETLVINNFNKEYFSSLEINADAYDDLELESLDIGLELYKKIKKKLGGILSFHEKTYNFTSYLSYYFNNSGSFIEINLIPDDYYIIKVVIKKEKYPEYYLKCYKVDQISELLKFIKKLLNDKDY